MSSRFRIRTSGGQEISFASHEMFAEFVRSGDLSSDDVVYDAETREWSSALTHPVVLQIQREVERDAEESDAAPGAHGGMQVEAEDATPEASGSDIGLDLAPEPARLTPEEEAAVFVQKMEAERASELEFDGDAGLQSFKRERSSGLVEGLDLVEALEESPSSTTHLRERSGDEALRVDPLRPAMVRARVPEKAPEELRAPGRKRRSATRRLAPFLMVGAGVVAASAYFGPELIASAMGEGREPVGESGELPPPPEPLIPDTEEALRERAQERFLTTTRALLRDLPPVPDVWLHGSYLAVPSDFPEVREVWNEYLTTVRQVRVGDNERYRAGYLRALEEALVDGPSRTLRAAGGVADFQAEEGARVAHYDRVEALAAAALRAHDALVEAEGTIAYEPATATPLSGDPVIQAVGRSPDAQEMLDRVLDMILAELEEPEGPGTPENLGEWIWEGILDAVAG